eukprot:scaffold1139_cov136-Isochrysis_galbana.AAC.3
MCRLGAVKSRVGVGARAAFSRQGRHAARAKGHRHLYRPCVAVAQPRPRGYPLEAQGRAKSLPKKAYPPPGCQPSSADSPASPSRRRRVSWRACAEIEISM